MEREITIDLGRCFKAILRKWWIITIWAFTGFGVLFAVMPSPTTVYYATTTVYGASYSYTESLQTVNLLSRYLDVANSKKVADRAASIIGNEALTGDMILGMTVASMPEDSAVMRIRAVSADPAKAIIIANAMADSFVIEAEANFGTNNVQVLDRAERVSSQTGRSKLTYGIIGFLAGLVISVVVIMLREIFSDRLYYVSDAGLNGELEILGVIPETRK